MNPVPSAIIPPMKRDLDLCRGILLALEQSQAIAPSFIEVPGYSREQIAYHEQLLADAGLVVCDNASCGQHPMAMTFPSRRLSWEGHEFLDASRPADRWQKAKAIAERAGGLTFEVLKTVLAELVKKSVGL